MSKREKADEGALPRGYRLVAYIAPVGVVTEGSRVELDGSQSYFEYLHNNNNNNNKFLDTPTATRPIQAADEVAFLWKQTEGPQVTLENEDSPTPSFTA